MAAIPLMSGEAFWSRRPKAIATATVSKPPPHHRTVPAPSSVRYKLLELIGEGGFGVVYMAEQQETVRRKVALKIIKLGMDTKQVIARFEAERQALALMDHPNIAKVLDAGATDSGRPYFVMELVRGFAITDYCDANHLTTKERLKLFIDVCQAVQHAHQKGIIHRDVKPTNVMVTQQDGRPVPKVIDFGIAKATEHRLTEKTLYTTYRQLIGTPEYMSPEQATFCEADIDTRSDIYSLGVLLYELLVGTTPFDAEALRSRGYDEICRVIRESDPPTPSKRLSTMGEVVTDISKHRHVEPAALRKLLRGDVDWIVMKALDKDRTTALRDGPRPGPGYRASPRRRAGPRPPTERRLSAQEIRPQAPRRGRRHRRRAGRAGCRSNAHALGFVRAEHERHIATAERDRANAERDRAKENLQLARQLVSDVIWPATERMYDFPFTQAYQHEVLEKARVFYEQILKQAGDDPEPRREMAQIHHRLGVLAWKTGQDAEPAYRRSLSILEDLVREFPSDPSYRSDLGNSHSRLAAWFDADLRFREAVEERRIALGIAQDLVAEFPSNEEYREAFAGGNWAVGWHLVRVGKFDEAEKYNRAAVTASERLPVFSRVISRYRLAYLLMRLARYDEAEQVVQEALAIAEQHLAPSASPPNAGWVSKIVWLAHSHRNVGLLHFYTGRFEDAEGHLRKAIDPCQALVRSFNHCPVDRFSLPSAWAPVLLRMVVPRSGRDPDGHGASGGGRKGPPLVAGGMGVGQHPGRRHNPPRQRSCALPVGRTTPPDWSDRRGRAPVRPSEKQPWKTSRDGGPMNRLATGRSSASWPTAPIRRCAIPGGR